MRGGGGHEDAGLEDSSVNMSSTSLSARIEATIGAEPRAAAPECSGLPRRCAPRPGSRLHATPAAPAGTPPPARPDDRGTPTRRHRRETGCHLSRRRPWTAPPARARGLPFGLAEHDDRTGLDDRQLLRRDRLPGGPEHLRVLQADVRQHLNRRAQDVRRVVAPAEALPRSTATSTLTGCELGQRRRGQRLELGGAEMLGGRPDSRQRSLEVGFTATDAILSAQPVTCGDVYAPVEDPRASASPRSSSSSSPCRSSRRRGSTGTRAAGRRASASSDRMRSVPNPSRGHGSRDSIQNAPVSAIAMSVRSACVPSGARPGTAGRTEFHHGRPAMVPDDGPLSDGSATAIVE